MRKIIHIDMDAFYASVEQRDDPSLRGKPVVVAWRGARSVVCAASYEARKFGVRSAMPAIRAERLCPQAIFVPPDFTRYKAVSRQVREIFARHTELIEPLSLDEAYLEVTDSLHFAGSATRIAEDIRRRVAADVGITVSAGVAPNKFLAKIASDWNKPDGLFVIRPEQVEGFVATLPVARLHGVGKVTAERLKRLGIEHCSQLREWDRLALVREFGSFGERLWSLARGVDERAVQVEHRRQSVSVENTFDADLPDLAACQAQLPQLLEQLQRRMVRLEADYRAEKPFVKLKFHDFSQTTLEQAGAGFALDNYRLLLAAAFARGGKPVRLLGVGIRLRQLRGEHEQLELFGRD